MRAAQDEGGRRQCQRREGKWRRSEEKRRLRRRKEQSFPRSFCEDGHAIRKQARSKGMTAEVVGGGE
ncbi:hypothetical protein L596_019158 [Steinernema carpocapsae]|uniref:Uncharacterized protein n=1 Tax=Steinernema carpocapsae TaxID=34508 RepID=A0A4U5N924_STECR|nr:hypothetical protein L596_019158 [Steinernema carpocapsae]